MVISDANTRPRYHAATMTSDDDFDDDDDDFLKALVADEQKNQVNLQQKLDSLPHNPIIQHNDALTLQSRLYKAEGEVSILREQLQQLQNSSRSEVVKLRYSLAHEKRDKDGLENQLRTTIQLLEDERKFLNNELKATSVALKRRKISESQNGAGNTIATPVTQLMPILRVSPHVQRTETHSIVPQKVIKIDNDASLFEDYLWTYCINGTRKTSIAYLSKVYLDTEIHIRGLNIAVKQPLSTAITDFFMFKKSLRLDTLIFDFCCSICELVEFLLEHQPITSIPFLLSLVYAALIFRSSALTKETLSFLIPKVSLVAVRYSFLLDSSRDQDDLINYHSVPLQVMILQKFTLVCCFDILERILFVATTFETDFSSSLWQQPLMIELVKICLPENSERFMNTTQINLVYNTVEMLISSITETSFGFCNNGIKDETIVNSLLKVFLIDIPIKDDFKFYGLNRVIGNNSDLSKVEATIPETETLLKESMVHIPCPVPQDLQQELTVSIETKHEQQLLNLRLRVATMIEGHIVTKASTQLFRDKEYLKSIVRYIGLEQELIMNSPRSALVHLRVRIVSTLVRTLHHIATDAKTITNVVYPETMYEVFVILLRIAFGSDSLSVEAYQLLSHARQMNYTGTVYNYWCEQRARQLGHSENADEMADVESEFANGLEFPYEPEIIELAREILEPCVTHEEADNLYFTMNYEEPRFDEMDLVV